MGLFGGVGRFWRLLLGIALAQVVAGVGVYVALSAPEAGLWPAAVLLALTAALLAACLLASVAAAERREQGAVLGLFHAREREEWRIRAEQRRVREVREAERRVARAQKRAGLPLRAGLLGGCVVGLGVALMAAQFVALGAVALSLVGGAALGWRLRGSRLGGAANAGPPTLEATGAGRARPLRLPWRAEGGSGRQGFAQPAADA